jgi:hypothetical protein
MNFQGKKNIGIHNTKYIKYESIFYDDASDIDLIV